MWLLTSSFNNSTIRGIVTWEEQFKTSFHYLNCRKQNSKMGSAYSNWSEVFRGIPKGSLLGLLLFNKLINNISLFIGKSEIRNFADDNILYSCDKNFLHIKKKIIFDTIVFLYCFILILFWFRTNFFCKFCKLKQNKKSLK